MEEDQLAQAWTPEQAQQALQDAFAKARENPDAVRSPEEQQTALLWAQQMIAVADERPFDGTDLGMSIRSRMILTQAERGPVNFLFSQEPKLETEPAPELESAPASKSALVHTVKTAHALAKDVGSNILPANAVRANMTTQAPRTIRWKCPVGYAWRYGFNMSSRAMSQLRSECRRKSKQLSADYAVYTVAVPDGEEVYVRREG